MYFEDIKKMTEDEKIEMITILQRALEREADTRELYEAQCQIQRDYIYNINQLHLREDARNDAKKKYNEFRTKMIMKYGEVQTLGGKVFWGSKSRDIAKESTPVEKEEKNADEEFEEDLPFATIKPEEEDKNP